MDAVGTVVRALVGGGTGEGVVVRGGVDGGKPCSGLKDEAISRK